MTKRTDDMAAKRAADDDIEDPSPEKRLKEGNTVKDKFEPYPFVSNVASLRTSKVFEACYVIE